MKTYSSRILPLALSAVLLLGACGSNDATGDGPIDTVGEQPGLRQPTPIQVTGVDGGGKGVASAAAESADASASSDMMFAPAYWVSEYVVGAGMPSLPTNDLGYVFDATRQVTAEQVAQIAAALGVVGEPVHLVEEYGSSWRVGPDDGSAPSLWVSEDSQQSWNYNSAWQNRQPSVGCAVAVDSSGNEVGECPEVEPPVGVPTQAEAQRRAGELLTALGEDVSALEVETYGDEWFASVTFSDNTDDRAALRQWNFGFGAEGVMDYASGSLAQAEPVGPYPLIDIDAALARLNDGGYGYGGYGGYMGGSIEPDIAIAEAAPADLAVGQPAGPEIAVDVPESDIATAAPEGSTEGSDGSTETVIAERPMPVDLLPIEDMPAPEPVVVTLVDVQADLWWAWDIDGSVWMLPAYRFIDTDGGWHTVPAVTDEFMIQVEPDVFIDEPLPAPQPLPVDPAPAPDPDVPAPIVEEPVTSPETVAPIELEVLVGLPVEDFTAKVEALGYSVRIAEQDGEGLALTADFSETRVNVAVKGGIVTAIVSLG